MHLSRNARTKHTPTCTPQTTNFISKAIGFHLPPNNITEASKNVGVFEGWQRNGWKPVYG